MYDHTMLGMLDLIIVKSVMLSFNIKNAQQQNRLRHKLLKDQFKGLCMSRLTVAVSYAGTICDEQEHSLEGCEQHSCFCCCAHHTLS